MTFENYLRALGKKIATYFKTFRKPILYFSGFITLIIGWKFIPMLFIMAYTPPPIAISADTATSEEWNKELYAIGTVAAVQSVTIASEVSGLITEISFNSGEEVKQGTKLIQLNDESEQADLKRYTSQLDLAKVTVDRTKQLTTRKVQSQAILDQDESRRDEALALVNQAKAIIAKKDIRAPFDGFLGIRQVNLGQYVGPGQAIVTLTDAKKVYINFTRPERDRHLLAVGQRVIATVDAYPDKKFEGTITTIDPQINQDTRTIPIQATLENPDLHLSAGMFAEIKVILPQVAPVTIVPETAVDYSLYGSAVFVITPENKDDEKSPLVVQRQYVKVGDKQNGKVAILDGLKAGERVVTAGQLKLNNGAHVAISEDKAPIPPATMTNH